MNVYKDMKARENMPAQIRVLLDEYEALLLPRTDRQPDRLRVLFRNQELKEKARHKIQGFNITHTIAPALGTFMKIDDVAWELQMLG